MALEGVSVLVWLMGSAVGTPRRLTDLHGPRLETLLERLVDTPVRGFVYEAGGSVPAELLARGAGLVRAASARWSMPVEAVDGDVEAMRAGVARVLVF